MVVQYYLQILRCWPEEEIYYNLEQRLQGLFNDASLTTLFNGWNPAQGRKRF